MQTTCPECRTTFRVSQDHLGARRGLVRCGTCQVVFNAYDTLLPELETPPPEALAHGADATAAYQDPPEAMSSLTTLSDFSENLLGNLSASAFADAAVSDADVEAEDSLAEPGIVLAGLEPADFQYAGSQVAQPEPVNVEPSVTEPSTAPVLAMLTAAKPAADWAAHDMPVHDILLQPMWPVVNKPKRTWRFWLYLLLASLLAGLLTMQTLYFLRGELAAALPATRPVLESLCRPFACTVPLARQLNKTAIAASALEHDPENKSRVKLSLLLANRTELAQAWPWITLTLSDVRQAPVAQKVFRPSAYLPKDMPKDLDIATGLAAGSEREIRLDLDIGNLVASGYALSLSYP